LLVILYICTWFGVGCDCFNETGLTLLLNKVRFTQLMFWRLMLWFAVFFFSRDIKLCARLTRLKFLSIMITNCNFVVEYPIGKFFYWWSLFVWPSDRIQGIIFGPRPVCLIKMMSDVIILMSSYCNRILHPRSHWPLPLT